LATRLKEPLREIAPGLYCADGWWKGSPMGRRMTVMRVGEDALAVHCAMSMPAAEMQRLDALGRVAYIIAPNPAHATEAPLYARRYPEAKVLVPAGMVRRQSGLMTIHGTIEDGWPPELDGSLTAVSVQGLRISESAYLHVASRTLVLTDLVMNFGHDHFRGLMKMMMRLNGIIDHFGPSHLLRYGLTRDRRKLRDSLEQIMAWDFDGVVMNHGRILTRGGKEKMWEAYGFLLNAGVATG
jgi:hypothetical protein